MASGVNDSLSFSSTCRGCRHPSRRADQRQPVLLGRAHFGGDGDLEFLERRAVEQVGLQAHLRELAREVLRRLVEPLGADAAAFQLIRRRGRSRFHVAGLPIPPRFRPP